MSGKMADISFARYFTSLLSGLILTNAARYLMLKNNHTK